MFKTSATSAYRISVPGFIASLVPYLPGKAIEERKYGITGSIKPAGNENPPGPSPKAPASLDDDQFRQDTQRVVAEVPVDAGILSEAMSRQGTILRPLHAYGMANAIGVKAGLPQENQRFVKTLGRVLQELQGLN